MSKYNEGDQVFTYYQGEEVKGVIGKIDNKVALIHSLEYVDGSKIDADEFMLVFTWDQSSLRKPTERFYVPSAIKTMHPLTSVAIGSFCIFVILLI